MPKLDARTVAEHRRKVLDKLYRSFESLIFERGYDAINLADIAQTSGMARTAIYHYFPDKESLLLAYTAHEMDDYFSELRAKLHDIDDPLERLDAYVEAQLTYFATHHLPPGPGLRSVLSADGYRAMKAHAEILEATLTAILEEAATDGTIERSVATDPTVIGLVQGGINSAPTRDVRDHALRDVITATQAFVRRSVGAPAST